MNIKFVAKAPKEMAESIPANLRKNQIDACEEIIAGAIRLVRGKDGQVMQRTKTIFDVWIDRVEPYPYVIREDDPEKPNIKLLKTPNHPSMIWFLQSAGNQKFIETYYKELCKLAGVDPDGATLEAFKNTEFEFEYKGKTPPPQPASATCADYKVESAHQKDLHRVKVEWAEGQSKPSWWSDKLNEQTLKAKSKNKNSNS